MTLSNVLHTVVERFRRFPALISAMTQVDFEISKLWDGLDISSISHMFRTATIETVSQRL
jgi:hypothetical protein